MDYSSVDYSPVGYSPVDYSSSQLYESLSTPLPLSPVLYSSQMRNMDLGFSIGNKYL